MTPCQTCPLRLCRPFVPMTEADVSFMASFKSDEIMVPRGAQILAEGAPSGALYTVLSGMGTRSKALASGERQVINFVFPGDFLGLQAGLMGEMKHSVEAATPMVLCVFERSSLWRLFQAHPERAYDLTWLAAVEEHFLGETLTALGRRDGPSRVAWALLRIHERLAAIGLGTGQSVPIAFRQQDLADALGLSLVHTNKTLMQLRKTGLARWAEGQLEIPDRARLARFAETPPEPLELRPLF